MTHIAASRPIVWLITDNKPGHKNQLLGLARALREETEIDCHWLEVTGLWRFLRQLLTSRFSAWPRPHLLIAAGRRTQLPLVVLKRLYGGYAAVVLRPGLPYRCFDFAAVPFHDNPPDRSNIVAIDGALTDIPPSLDAEPRRGLILIGGSSAHYGWDAEDLLRQLASLFAVMPDVSWTLTTSRRTPAGFLEKLDPGAVANLHHITLVDHSQTDRQWLLQQIAASGVIWVTEDSVSMVFEALSSGAAVGLLSMPAIRRSRVSAGVAKLVAQQRVTPLKALLVNRTMYPRQAPLQESARVARELLRRLNGHENSPDST